MRLAPLVLASMLVAGCGPDRAVDVPDVVALPLSIGAATLQERGLCVVVQQGSGPERRVVVVQQRPAAGSVVAEGSVVTIVFDAVVDVSADMEVIVAANAAMDCGLEGESDITE